MRAFRSIAPGFALALVLGASLATKAAPIAPGFDLFASGPSTLTIPPPQPCLPDSGPGTGVCTNGGFTPDSVTVTADPLALSPAPDPPTGLLLGTGLLGLMIAGRRRVLRH